MSYSAVLGTVKTAQVAAGPIVYRETGSGPPLVFLHGIVANGDLWRRVVPQLAGECRCITPDWPLGSHEAGLVECVDMSLPGLAGIVADFLAALGLEDVTLVANDTGGAIAQWVAAEHADRVARLVLTPCDAFDNFLPPVLRHLQLSGRWPASLWLLAQSLRLRPIQRLPIAFGRLTVRPIDPIAMESYTQPLRVNPAVRQDFARLVRAISSRYTREVAERLPQFDKPALVAWSRDDRLFPLEHGERLARLLPRSRFHIVEDSGAFIPEDQPDRLAALIRDFVPRSTSIT